MGEFDIECFSRFYRVQKFGHFGNRLTINFIFYRRESGELFGIGDAEKLVTLSLWLNNCMRN